MNKHKHWFYSIFLILLCLGAFSCATASFSADSARLVPDDFIGISPDRSPLQKADYDQLDELGVVWTRRTIRWSRVERREGEWDFSDWDVYVDNAKAAGKKVMLTLGFDNSWLYKDNREHRDLGERELPYFLAYVEKTVDHYRGRVDAFEIWNEPNAFFWDGSNRHFFELSRAAARRIRETDPDVTILAGALWRTQKSFVRGMFKAGAMENTDAISLHPYAVNPRGAVRQIDALKKIMDEYNYPGGIWITEMGYPTGGLYPNKTTLKKYPAYIVKTIAALAARGARTLVWYELMDEHNLGEAPKPWDSENYFGLIYPDNSRKEGAAAFVLCGRFLPGAEYRPELPERAGVPRSVTALCFRGADHSNTLVLWNNSPGKKRLRLVIPGTEILRYAIHTGEAETIPGDSALTLDTTPVFVRWTGSGAARLEGER